MYQSYDDDDLEMFEMQSGEPGAPDIETATSNSLWRQGLIEDPLDDSPSSENEGHKGIDEAAIPF